VREILHRHRGVGRYHLEARELDEKPPQIFLSAMVLGEREVMARDAALTEQKLRDEVVITGLRVDLEAVTEKSRRDVR